MPWHIPEDFKHFKEITMGKPCIMGRKTFESILESLGKPLPGRTSIVISLSGYTHEGAITFNSLEEAIEKAKPLNDEIIIMGGAQIYKEALNKNLVDTIHLTRVHQKPEGDAFFPELGSEWREISAENKEGYSFLIMQRV